MKATVILLFFFWTLNTPNFPKPSHSETSQRGFDLMGDAFQLTVLKKKPECAAVQLCK